MKKILFLLLGFSFFSSGCANFDSTKIDQKLFDKYLTKSYNYSKNKTWEATLAALKFYKTGIAKMDKARGIIITKKVPFYEMIRVTGYGGSGTGQSFVASHKYYLKVTGNSSKSTVKAYKYRFWRNNVEETKLNAPWNKENNWDPFFKEIQNQLEEM